MKVRSRVAGAVVALSIALGGMAATSNVVGAAPSGQSTVMAGVKAGQFCAKADVGKVVTASNGVKVICKNVDGYNRWVVK
jgi:hypothetical protein